MKRILAIDDDPGYQELMKAILSKEFDLTMCGSAEDALPKLDSDAYHLIITDINLLGMTGFEILARVRQSGLLKSCPVVFCTGQFDEDTKQKVLNMGVAGFIPKPFQHEAVLDLVRHLLGAKLDGL